MSAPDSPAASPAGAGGELFSSSTADVVSSARAPTMKSARAPDGDGSPARGGQPRPSAQVAATARNAGSVLRLSNLEIGMLAVAVVLCRILAARAFPIYDDAFITYRYARNLAEGLGLVFNPGAPWEPVLGTTTPGYAILLAGLHALGLDIIHASLAVNFLCDAICAVLLIHFFDRRYISSTIAVLAFACIPEITRISAGGMEAPVVLALALGAVAALQAGRVWWSGILAALCCCFRPEGVVLVAVLALWQIRKPRELARFLVPVAVIGVAVMGALWKVYDSPISHSIVAKASHHGVEQRWTRVGDILAQAFGPSQPMRLLFAIVAIGAVRCLVTRSRMRPFAVFAVAIVAAYVIARPKTWGWYFYPSLFAWVAWLGMGAEQIADWIGFDRLRLLPARSMARWTGAAAVLAIAAVSTFPLLRADTVTPRVYRHIEEWAREARLAERQATVLASDIGAIGYYARTRILDSQGLVWPEALVHTQQIEVIREHKPDYLMMVAKSTRLRPFRADEELSALYKPIRRFNEYNRTGLERLEPRLEDLPDWWEQDYIIYERQPAPMIAAPVR